MIIVNIIGGLGNQFFQYAFGYALSRHHNKTLKLDISAFDKYPLRTYELGSFNINPIIATEDEITNAKAQSIYIENKFNYDISTYLINSNQYYKGYWQTDKYFWEYRKNIIKQFKPINQFHPQSQKTIKNIKESESISIHIRRGDYISNPKTNSFHGVCSVDYYKESISIINESISNPHFFIFSDDLDWAINNITFIDNVTFVELAADVPDYEELFLMSRCQHNIIANSSFSWWGAWLNQNENKIVIAPKQWFLDTSLNTTDLIPSNWLRV